MARNKYIYHHFIGNNEVSKDDFIKSLSEHFLVCDTNYNNPLLNVCFVDEQAVMRKYNYLKTHNRTSVLYISNVSKSSNSFRITREEIHDGKKD